MQNQNGRRMKKAQRAMAEVIDIAAHRAKVSVSDQALVSRFRAKGVGAIAIEYGVPRQRVENALRERIDFMPRKAA